MNRTLKAALLTATAAIGGLAMTGSASASVLATVTDSYSNSSVDVGYATLTNNSSFWETNVTIFGQWGGSVAPGGSVTVSLGDIDDFCYGCNIPVSFKIGSQTFSRVFPFDWAVLNDNYGATGVLGTISGNVPEPATMALVGTALLGAAGLRRRRRKSA